MAVEKRELREVLRACRGGLQPHYVAATSAAIQRRLIESAPYRNARAVALYAAQDNEVQTDLIFADAMAAGRDLFFPRVVSESRTLELVKVRNTADFAAGAFGLREPTGAETVPVVALCDALICVPGIAFSRDGQRIGRGGGYYDRLLAEASLRVQSAGLAYAFQVLDWIPQSPDDRRLNLIVTESALHEAAAQSERPSAWTDQGGSPC